MSDWPANIPSPTHIHSFTNWVCSNAAGFGTVLSPGSTSWGVANTAAFYPLVVPCPYLVRRVFWANGSSVAGNVDAGIYTQGGSLLGSAGSTAQSGASVLQYDTLTTPVLLLPGRLYYLAYANSNSSTANRAWASTTIGAGKGRVAGFAQMAAALPLPQTATFATYDGTVKHALVGVTRTASGF